MKPVILPLDPMAIPAELRDIPAWIGWKLVQRDGRWSKEPITIQNGVLAETDNPATWCTFQTAVEGYKRLGCDGIGMCRTGDLVFLDLDGVLDSAGGLKPFVWTSKILSTIEGRAYVEKSATGTGIHAICRGSLPAGRRQFDLPDAQHTGFAFYDRSRFFTFTGSVLPQSGAIQVLTPQLAVLHRELFPPKASVNGNHGQSPLSFTDSELLERARRAANGPAFWRVWNGDWQDKYASQSEADLALCCHLAFWTRRDGSRIDALFRQSGLYRQDKWERADYRERTITAAVQQTRESMIRMLRILKAEEMAQHAVVLLNSQRLMGRICYTATTPRTWGMGSASERCMKTSCGGALR
jgi:primase-polymerase (primpol)-like protein